VRAHLLDQETFGRKRWASSCFGLAARVRLRFNPRAHVGRPSSRHQTKSPDSCACRSGYTASIRVRTPGRLTELDFYQHVIVTAVIRLSGTQEEMDERAFWQHLFVADARLLH
jgi:hypothetical protein